MVERFEKYIREHNLFAKGDKILLAVSGGIDSVVMTELFFRAGYTFGIAHCNFHLRTGDCDKDEQFVKSLSEKYGVPFHVTGFDTLAYAEEKGLSIQMAARELRYNFFDEVMNEYDYAYTATAHHLNDSIETFFINLLRGTGISGLHGILPASGKFIRPMLPFTREEIAVFYKENGLTHREDKSNKSTKYKRNKIRHEIIPVLMEIKPEFEKVMSQNIERIVETEQMLKGMINVLRQKLFKQVGSSVQIEIKEIAGLSPLKTYLFELFKEYSFSETTLENIADTIANEGISGKQFFSATHRLTKDRELLIIEPAEDLTFEEYVIPKDTHLIVNPIKLQFQVLSKDENFKIDKTPSTAFLDYDKLNFPLTLNKWNKGDRFIPYGMKNKGVLLSDFFNNNKLSIPQKEKVWLLKSQGEIVWVVGMRVDERFCVTETTKKVLKVVLV